jgi:signal transduction histidine kinase
VTSLSPTFMSAAQNTSFTRLVSLACHDLRTPLATVSGFARTIQRNEDVEDPLSRYLEMIVAASEQMRDLLELLSVAARIEGGRYDPALAEIDTLDAARAAAEEVEGARAEGAGETIETDVETVTRSLAAFASSAHRHGRVPEVTLAVNRREITIAPIGEAAAVIVGEDLKDLGAAVAVRAVGALGGSATVDGDALRVTL